MPCTYYTEYEKREMIAKRLADERDKVDRLTRLLCLATKGETSEELEAWKVEHAEIDRMREEAEMRAAEDARLTAEAVRETAERAAAKRALLRKLSATLTEEEKALLLGRG